MKTENSLINKSDQTTEFLWSWEQASPLTKVAIGLIDENKTLPLISLQEISEELGEVDELNGFDLLEAVSRGIGWKALDSSEKIGQVATELATFCGGDEAYLERAKQVELKAEESGIELVVGDLDFLWNMASLRLDLNSLPVEQTD
jgi:hypothetical protein